jgi:ferredoxin--NADP+ reductase
MCIRDRHGRATTLLANGNIQKSLGFAALNPEHDRAMICGSPQMLADFREILDANGLKASGKIGQSGHYVFERAFVDK